mgnify:CR=1 FL=1
MAVINLIKSKMMMFSTKSLLLGNQARVMLMRPQTLVSTQSMLFTGKTESGHKFTTPKMRMRVVRPI